MTDLLAQTVPDDFGFAVAWILAECGVERAFIHVVGDVADKQPEPLCCQVSLCSTRD